MNRAKEMLKIVKNFFNEAVNLFTDFIEGLVKKWCETHPGLTSDEQEGLEKIVEQQDQLAEKNEKATKALENFELSAEMVGAGITKDTIKHVIKDYF